MRAPEVAYQTTAERAPSQERSNLVLSQSRDHLFAFVFLLILLFRLVSCGRRAGSGVLRTLPRAVHILKVSCRDDIIFSLGMLQILLLFRLSGFQEVDRVLHLLNSGYFFLLFTFYTFGTVVIFRNGGGGGTRAFLFGLTVLQLQHLFRMLVEVDVVREW